MGQGHFGYKGHFKRYFAGGRATAEGRLRTRKRYILFIRRGRGNAGRKHSEYSFLIGKPRYQTGVGGRRGRRGSRKRIPRSAEKDSRRRNGGKGSHQYQATGQIQRRTLFDAAEAYAYRDFGQSRRGDRRQPVPDGNDGYGKSHVRQTRQAFELPLQVDFRQFMPPAAK